MRPHHTITILALAAFSPTPVLAQRYIVGEPHGAGGRFHLLDTRVGARFEYDAIQLLPGSPLTGLTDVAHVRGELWVAQWTFPTGPLLTRFDPVGGAVLGNVALGAFDGLVQMAVVADGVWLTGHVQLQKRSFTGALVATVSIPHVVDITTDGNEVLALRTPIHNSAAFVDRYDTAGNVLGLVTLGVTGSQADTLGLRASNGNFLLTGGVRLYECDRTTGSIVQELDASLYQHVAVELVDGRLFLLNSGDASIVDVEGAQPTFSTVPTTAGFQLRFLAPFDSGDPGARRFCPSGPNSSGAAARIGVRGTSRTSDGTLWLDAFGGPAGAAGLFLYGNASAPQVLGNGTLCLSGSIIVLRRTLGPFDAAGNRSSVALGYASLPSVGPIVSGSTWTFQYLFRDAAAGGAAFDLTDAIELTFD
jgi:hypothetical protein